jgi:hypothetical protein
MYSAEVLAEIERLAHLYMQRDEIAIITAAEIDHLADPEHVAGRALLKGRLIRKAEFNSAIIKLTGQLSSPAMAIEYKIAEQTYLNDIK